MITEERVIEAVRKHPCLYDLNDAAYHDKVTKEKAWNDAAQECDGDPEELRKMWRLVRDNYTRCKRRAEQKRNGDGETVTPHYKHCESLSFLNDFIKPRPSVSNLTHSEENFPDPQSELPLRTPSTINEFPQTSSQTETHPRKRKFTASDPFEERILSFLENGNDEDELYCRSIMATMKRLGLRRKALAKMKIQEILLNIEFPSSAPARNDDHDHIFLP